MATLDVIRRGAPDPPHDLWPRLRARLEERDDLVRLHVPALGWRGVAALAAVAATLLIVPDPLAFLATSGIL
jgi:hypothetical protein